MNLNFNEPRAGGLMLCQCGHLKVFHFAHPQWHGGPLCDGAPCVHCKPAPGVDSSCQGFKPSDYQGYTVKQDPHA